MPFNFLLWNCLLPGKTSHHEQGKGIQYSASREGGETFLLFALDDRKSRDYLMKQQLCDLVALYRKSGERPVVLFIELKGSDYNHAVRQITATFEGIAARYARFRSATTIRALVVSSSAAPPNQKRLQQALMTECGISLVFETGVKKRAIDIRKYL